MGIARSHLMAGLALALMTAACGPAGAGPTASTEKIETTPGEATRPTQVVMAATRDVVYLATKFAGVGSVESDFAFIVNSPLVLLDSQGAPRPFLAVELPSQSRGTWTIRPDSTMETLWRIQPNAVWHDGQPITSRDFSFAYSVYVDPGLEIRDREPENLIERIELVDDKTFRIHWKQFYLRADQLIYKRLPPLPEHLLGQLYEGGDKAGFQNASFWTTPEYVGSGPFRILEWEKGVRHVYGGFAQHFAGPPKIDKLIVQIIPDPNTVIANVLGGAADITGASGIPPRSKAELEEGWGRSTGGRILVSASVLRTIRFQHNPAWTQQPALLDARVRRAMARAIDRVTNAETVSAGTSPVAHTFITPSDPLYPRVQQAIDQQPFDRTAALALLQEAGWMRAGDRLVNAQGDPFTLNLRSTTESNDVLERQAIGSDLRWLGMDVTEEAYRQGSLNTEQSAKLPGIQITTIPFMDVPEAMAVYASERCPTPERRYLGENRGCWSNPEYDRFFRLATTTRDDAERATAVVQGLRILTEDVGALGTSFNMQISAVRAGLVGPGTMSVSQRGYTWNIHEWHWS